MNKFTIAFLGLIICSLLAGCANNGSVGDPEAALSTSAEVIASATPEPTSTLTPTSTPVPTSTATAAKTSTPTQTATTTMTSTPTATPYVSIFDNMTNDEILAAYTTKLVQKRLFTKSYSVTFVQIAVKPL